MESITSGSGVRGHSALWVYALLLAIFVLAFALRAYRLEEQSVWSHEFDSFPKDAPIENAPSGSAGG